MKTNQESDDREVGYGKPPRDKQFRKGHSGNRKGRPKGSKNSATVLKKVLLGTVTASEDGHHRKITKLEAIIRRLVTKAVLGDHRSIALLLDRTAGLDLSTSAESHGLTPEDLDRMYERLCDSVLRGDSR